MIGGKMRTATLKKIGVVVGIVLWLSASLEARVAKRWQQSKANSWYASEPWLVGSNYIPASAINQLEMWQAATFDPKRIDLELAWAESIGLRTMRVFLHDLLWQQDSAGFTERLNTFLEIADKHHIKPIFVLFDSCWDPNPQLGKQREPRPGIHNSGWMQSPGAKALQDPAQYPRLKAYVEGVVGAFANDQRVLGWDVWNEPDNTNQGSYGDQEPKNKVALILALLPKVFTWAREAEPSQPLTSGVWKGRWSSPGKLDAMEKIQIGMSDVISFHSYDKPDEFERRIVWLQPYHRPILCTEYMARGVGSTFQGSLPIAKKYHVAAINWGLVAGKTQTYLPWDSWQHPYTDREPAVWFHEIFRTDGSPYSQQEVDFIRGIIGSAQAASIYVISTSISESCSTYWSAGVRSSCLTSPNETTRQNWFGGYCGSCCCIQGNLRRFTPPSPKASKLQTSGFPRASRKNCPAASSRAGWPNLDI